MPLLNRNRRFLPAALIFFPVCCLLPAGAQTSESPAPAASDSSPAAVQPMPLPSSPDAGPIRADAKGELRGMWVVRESLASPQSVHQVVLTASKYHLNAIFVQVRGRGDAWYNSPYEPRADDLSWQPKGWDPLEQMVREGHSAGLQVHAWLNTFLTWSGSKAPRSPQHLWNAHRDWFACDRNGNCSPIPNNRSEGAFLSPSNPKVKDHLVKVFSDVAARYDIDGIHFDYCRYCSTAYDYRSTTLNRFRDAMTPQIPIETRHRVDARLKSDRLAYVHAFGAQWADWRRAQITDIVSTISATVKAAKPWMEVSAAVFPDANEAFIERGQDWRGWLKSGALDAVALMAYNKNTQCVLRQTREALAAAGEKHVYTGVGAWRLGADDVAHKIAEIRKTGAAGVNLFSYGGVHTRANYLDKLARGVFASRSAPRRMRWLPSRGASALHTDAAPPTPGSSEPK